jgi:hypothetical protein
MPEKISSQPPQASSGPKSPENLETKEQKKDNPLEVAKANLVKLKSLKTPEARAGFLPKYAEESLGDFLHSFRRAAYRLEPSNLESFQRELTSLVGLLEEASRAKALNYDPQAQQALKFSGKLILPITKGEGDIAFFEHLRTLVSKERRHHRQIVEVLDILAKKAEEYRIENNLVKIYESADKLRKKEEELKQDIESLKNTLYEVNNIEDNIVAGYFAENPIARAVLDKLGGAVAEVLSQDSVLIELRHDSEKWKERAMQLLSQSHPEELKAVQSEITPEKQAEHGSTVEQSLPEIIYQVYKLNKMREERALLEAELKEYENELKMISSQLEEVRSRQIELETQRLLQDEPTLLELGLKIVSSQLSEEEKGVFRKRLTDLRSGASSPDARLREAETKLAHLLLETSENFKSIARDIERDVLRREWERPLKPNLSVKNLAPRIQEFYNLIYYAYEDQIWPQGRGQKVAEERAGFAKLPEDKRAIVMIDKIIADNGLFFGLSKRRWMAFPFNPNNFAFLKKTRDILIENIIRERVNKNLNSPAGAEAIEKYQKLIEGLRPALEEFMSVLNDIRKEKGKPALILEEMDKAEDEEISQAYELTKNRNLSLIFSALKEARDLLAHSSLRDSVKNKVNEEFRPLSLNKIYWARWYDAVAKNIYAVKKSLKDKKFQENNQARDAYKKLLDILNLSTPTQILEAYRQAAVEIPLITEIITEEAMQKQIVIPGLLNELREEFKAKLRDLRQKREMLKRDDDPELSRLKELSDKYWREAERLGWKRREYIKRELPERQYAFEGEDEEEETKEKGVEKMTAEELREAARLGGAAFGGSAELKVPLGDIIAKSIKPETLSFKQEREYRGSQQRDIAETAQGRIKEWLQKRLENFSSKDKVQVNNAINVILNELDILKERVKKSPFEKSYFNGIIKSIVRRAEIILGLVPQEELDKRIEGYLQRRTILTHAEATKEEEAPSKKEKEKKKKGKKKPAEGEEKPKDKQAKGKLPQTA